jgi:chromosome segregation ATPase
MFITNLWFLILHIIFFFWIKISESLDSVRNELHRTEESLKISEEKLHDRDELIRDNEFLRVQLKLMEQKFERFTIEYSKKIEENRQHEHEYNDQIQSLIDEIERIKRDLVLEEYRKQEAERKVRYYDEKIKIEQNLNKKLQQDSIQLKQELKSIHMRYDSLQIEMLAMHKANNNDVSLIPTKDTNEWTKKRAINHDIVREYLF